MHDLKIIDTTHLTEVAELRKQLREAKVAPMKPIDTAQGGFVNMKDPQPSWHLFVFYFCLAFAVSQFARGIWKYDQTCLALAFVFLGLAWLWREMIIGWMPESKTWRFLPWRHP